MSQDAVASDVVAICLSRDELMKKGLIPDELSGRTARRLITETLKSRGEEPWEDMEVEVFTTEDALLVLARPAWNEHHLFYFSDSAGLLSAVEGTDRSLPSSLIYINGEFVLCIRASLDSIPASMFEFGYHENQGQDYIVHMAEHGKRIISYDALEVLRDNFFN